MSQACSVRRIAGPTQRMTRDVVSKIGLSTLEHRLLTELRTLYHHVHFDECIYVITNHFVCTFFPIPLPTALTLLRSLLADSGRRHRLHHVFDKSHHPPRPAPNRSQERERARNDHLCTFTLEDLTRDFRSDSWGGQHLSGRFLDSFFLVSGHVGFDE
jgi:hypothetical protein